MDEVCALIKAYELVANDVAYVQEEQVSSLDNNRPTFQDNTKSFADMYFF